MQTSKRLWLCISVLGALGTGACGAVPEEAMPEYTETSSLISSGATYTLKGVHSGLCLDVANRSTADGANVQLYACNGQTQQQWRFESVGSGYFRVVSVLSNKCLDIAGVSTANGANVQQWACNGQANQQFSVPDVGSGAVRLVARNSGKALDAWGWGTTNGTNVAQYNVTGAANQHFTTTVVGSSGGGSTGGGSTGSGSTGSGSTGGGSTGGGSTCSSITDFGVVNSTIKVVAGQPFDGGCRRYRAGSALGDGSQDEGQQPVFRLENGAVLRNVVLGAPAADGIHTYGNVTLQNVHWEDIGEDALTIKGSGTVTLNGGSARNGDDKVFQVNAASTFRISNFAAKNAGKLIRQNGGTTFRTDIFIDRSDIADMDECIFRTDSSSSTVTMTNTRYHNIGDSLFIGVSSSNISQSNNTQY